MDYLSFEINRITSGWFDVVFTSNKKQMEISASYAWGNDSPKYFLKMISDFLNNKTNTGYVVFDEEPGTYVVYIEKEVEYRLSILFSRHDSYMWKEIELHGFLNRQQIEEEIPIDEDFYIQDFDFTAFSKTIMKSFEKYSSGIEKNQYEKNWTEFPNKEFVYLCEQIEKSNNNKNVAITFEEAFCTLSDKYGEDFNWSSIEFSNQYFVKQAKKEIKQGYPLFGKIMYSTAKCESNDDVMYVLENGTYAIIHLTYSENINIAYPTFKEFENLKQVMEYIEQKYVEDYL